VPNDYANVHGTGLLQAVEGAMTDDRPKAPRLPRDVRQAASTAIGLAVIGLGLFVGGVLLGSLDNLPAPGVIAGATLIVCVGVIAIVWLRRVGKP